MAGLECGILGQNYPNMDMISFGPTINGAHSPDERVSIRQYKILEISIGNFSGCAQEIDNILFKNLLIIHKSTTSLLGYILKRPVWLKQAF